MRRLIAPSTLVALVLVIGATAGPFGQPVGAQDLTGEQSAPFPLALACSGGNIEVAGSNFYSMPDYATCENDLSAELGLTSFVLYPTVGGLPDLALPLRANYYRYSMSGFTFTSPGPGTLSLRAEVDAGTYYCLEVAEGPGRSTCSLGTERSVSLAVPILGAHDVRVWVRPIPIVGPGFARLNNISYSFVTQP